MMNESPMVTRSTIPLATTSFFFQSNSWYLTDELPQLSARISIAFLLDVRCLTGFSI